MAQQALHYGRDVAVMQIRGKLHKDGNSARKICTRGHHGFEQRIQPVRRLQVSQARRVRGRNVDREVGGQRPKGVDACNIVGDRVAGIAVRANIHAEDAARGPARKPDECSGMARAIEAEAIDDASLAHQPEHARARISRLRLRRYSADLRKAETDVEQRIVDACVLVIPSRDADRIGKGEAEHSLRKA